MNTNPSSRPHIFFCLIDKVHPFYILCDLIRKGPSLSHNNVYTFDHITLTYSSSVLRHMCDAPALGPAEAE